MQFSVYFDAIATYSQLNKRFDNKETMPKTTEVYVSTATPTACVTGVFIDILNRNQFQLAP